MTNSEFCEGIRKDREILEQFDNLDSAIMGYDVEDSGYIDLSIELDDVKSKFFGSRREVYMRALEDMDNDEFFEVFEA